MPEAIQRCYDAPRRKPSYEGSSTIVVFDCAARLVETIATPMHATAMPSHIVAVGGTP